MWKLLTILLIAAALATPANSQTLEQQENINKLDKLLDAVGELDKIADKISRERRIQCVAAIADTGFCDCLGKNLPFVIDFTAYVTIVTQTKEQLHYERLSAEDKRVVDNTRRTRDICVKAR